METRVATVLHQKSDCPTKVENYSIYLLFFDRGVVSVDHVTGHGIARTEKAKLHRSCRNKFSNMKLNIAEKRERQEEPAWIPSTF